MLRCFLTSIFRASLVAAQQQRQQQCAGTRASVVIVRRRRTQLRSHYTTDREPGDREPPLMSRSLPADGHPSRLVVPTRLSRRPSQSAAARQEVPFVVAVAHCKKQSTWSTPRRHVVTSSTRVLLAMQKRDRTTSPSVNNG